MASALRDQLCEWAPASHRRDQRVPRRRVEGRSPQQRAGAEPQTKFRAVEPVVSLLNHFNLTDPCGKSLTDCFGRELSTGEGERYAAAGERIDERAGVTD